MINNYRVVLGYLNRKARVPKVPERLVDEIMDWITSEYNKLFPEFNYSRADYMYFYEEFTRTFTIKQEDLLQGTLKTDPHRFKVLLAVIGDRDESEYEIDGQWEQDGNLMFIVGDNPFFDEDSEVHGTRAIMSRILSNIRTTVIHELMHFLQYNTVENIGQGIGRDGRDKSDSDEGTFDTSYYQSEVEYKPHLGDQVRNFSNEKGEQFQKLMATDRLRAKSLIEEWVANSKFFQSIKKLRNLKRMVPGKGADNTAWKWDRSKIRDNGKPVIYEKAVRDFYTLVIKKFQEEKTPKSLDIRLKDFNNRYLYVDRQYPTTSSDEDFYD